GQQLEQAHQAPAPQLAVTGRRGPVAARDRGQNQRLATVDAGQPGEAGLGRSAATATKASMPRRSRARTSGDSQQATSISGRLRRRRSGPRQTIQVGNSTNSQAAAST